jgi:hypothetical protein
MGGVRPTGPILQLHATPRSAEKPPPTSVMPVPPWCGPPNGKTPLTPADGWGSGPFLLLAAHYSLLTTHYSLLATRYSLLATRYSLLTTHYALRTTHLLLTTHYLLLTEQLVGVVAEVGGLGGRRRHIVQQAVEHDPYG